MYIYLDKDIFEALMADYVGPVVSESVHDSLDSDRVIAVCSETKQYMSLPLPAVQLYDVREYVVVETENDLEIGRLRCEGLAEAITAAVNAAKAHGDGDYYAEVCADYGNLIDGVCVWNGESRYADGRRWETVI